MPKIEAVPGYLIFFDNVRVDPLVKNFSSSLSNDGSIGRANIDMIYLPELDRVLRKTLSEINKKEDAIDNMTNCKIFIKNIFNDKYTMVFDGNIRGKAVSESPSGNSLSYIAIDHLETLNNIIAPLAVPLTSSIIFDQTMFKLKSQGIDADKISPINPVKDITFKDKNIQDILSLVKQNALLFNKIYSDTEGVLYWNNASDRILLMGDISRELMKSDILDYRLSSEALKIETMYVLLNDVVQRLMFEFFQDRDGVIKIKPPFWNEKVMLNHVIDSSLIMGYSEHSSWENLYTRVVTIGGMNQLEQVSVGATPIGQSLMTPMGVYSGNLNEDGKWADSRVGIADGDNTLDEYTIKFDFGETGISWLDNASLGALWKDTKEYMSWEIPRNSSIRHIGWRGEVTYVGEREEGRSAGTSVRVKIIEGPYKNCEIVYSYFNTISVKIGQRVEHDESLGNTVRNDTLGHLSISIRTENYGITAEVQEDLGIIETVDPLVYCRDYITGKEEATFFDIQNTGIDSMLYPSALERKHGTSVFSSTQPLIKASTALDKSGDAYKALKKYSMFMYNMLNSMANTATVNLVAAPWLRPGMNVWLSPTKSDKIYYVANISHNGNPQSGAYTTVNLVHGRDSYDFFAGKPNMFGTLKGSSDNIFVNTIDIKPEHIGPVINNFSEYNKLLNKSKEFHQANNNGIIKANKSSYLRDLYGYEGNQITLDADNKTLAAHIFSRDLTITEIQEVLDNLYSQAPSVVKERSKKIKEVVEMAKDYAYKKYVSSVFKK